jgi:hypothetical protein
MAAGPMLRGYSTKRRKKAVKNQKAPPPRSGVVLGSGPRDFSELSST